MFVVYNSKTNCAIQENDNIMMCKVSVNYLTENIMILTSCHIPDLVLNINYITKHCTVVKCISSLYGKILVQFQALDCGPEAAFWISRCALLITCDVPPYFSLILKSIKY